MPASVVLTPERGATIHCPATAQSQIILLVSDSSSSKNQWSPLDKNGPLLSLLSTNGTLLNLHPFRPEQFRPDVHSAFLQVRGGQSSRTYRLHARPCPPHHQQKIRGRRGESPSPARVDDRLSLFLRGGLFFEGRPRCRRHFVDSRQSTRHFPLRAQSRSVSFPFLPGKLINPFAQ